MENNRLYLIRKNLKLSQKEMSNLLSIPYTTLSRYENNVIKPSFDILSKIAKQFNVNINWLLTGRGSMFLDNGTKMKADVPMFTRKFTDDEHSGLSDREYIEKVQDEVLELRKDLDELRRKLIDLQQKYIELMEKIRK